MNLSVVDNIVIQAALRSKADYYNEQIEKYPSDKFWTDKLNDVKTAYRNFSDRVSAMRWNGMIKYAKINGIISI